MHFMRAAMTDTASRLYEHVAALFPICRSITGPGLRQTLDYVRDITGATIHEVATGASALDWEIPKEWTPRSATISRISGEVVVDFADHNLHLLQYSHAVDRIVPAEELARHLFSLPDQPELIPYRTAYYADTWGFCLSERQRSAMTDAAYRVRIDADLAPGRLNYGELYLPGESDKEILLSVHCCHPSLANDNLSSIAVAIELARHLAVRANRRYGYRFLFVPGTIGAIAWLEANRDAPSRVVHGLVLSCLGDGGAPTYKQSRRGDAMIDRIAAHVLRARGHDNRVRTFVPYGYDERQYCSPGFNLPVGCLMRSPNGSFPEYHTSADNLTFVKPDALADSLDVLTAIVDVIECDRVPVNLSPFGEPQLGRRGLYAAIGGQNETADADRRFDQLTLLWVLNQADGTNSLLDIAERAEKPFRQVVAAAAALQAAGLLRDAGEREAGLTHGAAEPRGR